MQTFLMFFKFSRFPLFLGVIFLFLTSQTHSAESFRAPELSSPVVDQVSLLSKEEQNALRVLILELNQKAHLQMAVLIPTSLEGLSIEEYSIKVAEVWKLGEKKTDEGLLFVLAPNERKMRLEVGYGLEGDLPDARVKQILSDRVRPLLKAGQTSKAIASIVFSVAEIKGVKLSGETPHYATPPKGSPFGILVFVILIIVLMMMGVNPFALLYLLSGGGGGGRSGGGSGGGFSGGGGGFGGGGASSDW